MRIFHGLDNLPNFTRPAATVGSYDGVHGGHMVLLRSVVEAAHEQNGESIVITFNPHPRVTLGCAEGLRLLTSIDEKSYLLERAGIDNLIIIPFDEQFSKLSPELFVRDYLIKRIGVKSLIVGYNHHFGHDKQGNYSSLESLHEQYDLKVVRVAEYDSNSEKVSSTVIRHLVERGEMAHAARLMPHPYLLIGEAEEGRIVISEPLKLLPPPGDYPARCSSEALIVTITNHGEITTSKSLSTGKVIITFEL